VVTGKQLVLYVALRAARANRRLFTDLQPRPPETALSRRQIEIVRLIALGLSGPEIAGELNIAHDTVRAHVRNSMANVGARTRAQLVAKALAEGLLWGV
jgi:DNA-binding NarL/FixJ family response regulator